MATSSILFVLCCVLYGLAVFMLLRAGRAIRDLLAAANWKEPPAPKRPEGQGPYR